jgi:hypothetical protein
MHDDHGKPTGQTQAIGKNDDPKRVAARLKLSASPAVRGNSNFNRSLDYQPMGHRMKKPQALSLCGYRVKNVFGSKIAVPPFSPTPVLSQ